MSVPHPKRKFHFGTTPNRVPEALSPADGTLGPRSISAALARRLAAAADGHRDGQEIYFQARFEPGADGDFDVTGPFSREQAEQQAPPEGFGIFGPYRTDECEDDISRTPVKRVTMELTNGEVLTFEGSRYDALFWSSSALEKFVVPYYAMIAGVDRATRLRDTFLTPAVFMIAHDPNTEETMITVRPQPGTQLLPTGQG
jgi:hypothetical protein